MSKSILQEDFEWLSTRQYIDWNDLKNQRILVTGATGLIGSTLVRALIYASAKYDLNIGLYALVRDQTKAIEMFGNSVHYLVGSVEDAIVVDEKIDYIINTASPTASNYFVEKPVETIKTAVLGNMNLLEYARLNAVKGYVYLSSMEVYGEIRDERPLNEHDLGFIDPLILRSSYPESKRLCEALCASYASEYGVKAVALRLAQTFGPGVAYSDKRVFAMMARCAMNNENIVLKTKGTSRHSYLYTAQAVSAIICAMLRGEGGKAYNVANPDTYCSIYEMGQMVADRIANGGISVIIPEEEDTTSYPAPSFLNLNIDSIRGLGWYPEGTLEDMYRRMIMSM